MHPRGNVFSIGAHMDLLVVFKVGSSLCSVPSLLLVKCYSSSKDLELCGLLRITHRGAGTSGECVLGLYSLNEDDFFQVFIFHVA